jgi:hypothetical protein
MSAAEFSRPTTRKPRGGRPRGAVGPQARAIQESVRELRRRYRTMTVRQVYYQLEMAGVVEKTEGGYRQVQRELLRMRRERLLSWGFIADGTRWQRKPTVYDDARDYLEAVSRAYRRDLWQRQKKRIEIWLEKDALADVIYEVTGKWDVPLMVSRGQSSATFLYSAAKEAERVWRDRRAETFIYSLYDADAGGNRAARTIARELPQYAGGVPIHVERLAVTEDQIAEWSLPTRPAKQSDPEAAKNPATAVELDAIDPDRLTTLVEDAIVRHIDMREWEIEEKVELEERRGLLRLPDLLDEDDER